MRKKKIISMILAISLTVTNIGFLSVATEKSEQINVEAETEINTESEKEAETESEINTESEKEAETESEINTKSEKEAETESEINTESESETETEINTESKKEAETESEINTESESETETEINTESEKEAETESEINTESESETEINTESETEIESDTKFEVESETVTDITDENLFATQGLNEDGTLDINELNFPDATFREYLSQNFDNNTDNVLSTEELNLIIEIDLSDYSQKKTLSDITGIEYFSKLEKLRCIGLNLLKLDISNNINLTELYCSSNKLEQLDLKYNINLKYMSCGDNPLKTLDVSNNTNLLELHCYQNGLTSLDISKNAALTYLYCNENELTNIDTSKNIALTQLSCSYNKITSLDLTGNNELAVLICDNNMVTALDVSKNSKLTDLFCGKNELNSIDVKNNIELRQLYFGNNQIAKINVSINKNLESIDATNNKLTWLDLSQNTQLCSVQCDGNEIAVVNLRNCERKFYTVIVPAMSTVYCHPNTQLEQYCIKKGIQYKTEEPPKHEDTEAGEPSGDEDLEQEIDLHNLSNATITCANTYLKAKKDNKGQLPQNIKVTIGNKTLKKNKDYTIAYYKAGSNVKNLTTPGVYDMTITGIGDYKGTNTIQITVTEKKLLSGVTVKTNKIEYTGKPITDGVIKSVKSGKINLEEGKDYIVEYSNNIDSGKGTIVLKATENSDYDGYKTVKFDIVGIKMSKIKAKGISDKDFNVTGNIEQNLKEIVLTHTLINKETKQKETVTLKYDKDYEVYYQKNNKAGTAKIIFTGKGLYNGTLTKSFKIKKVKLTDKMLGKSKIVAYMDKKGVKPDVILTYNGVQLLKDVDYKVSYSNNKKVTTADKKAKITITGKGNYSGKITTAFDILPKNIADESITVKTSDVQFDSNSETKIYTTKVNLYDNGSALKEKKDYIVKASENKVNGLPAEGYTTSTVIIEGVGNYCGTKITKFKIVTRLLNDSLIKTKIKGKYYYFGSPVTVEKKNIIVTDKGNENKQLDFSEYEITGYKNNKAAGTASVTIKGLGKYGGSKTITYTINSANIEKTKAVIDLVNKERASRGLNKLKMNQKIMQATMIRAEEISTSFSHTRPDGRSYYTILDEMDIERYGSGENIAAGYVSAEHVMSGWMNSPGHKANILNASFDEIGVGCFEKDGRLYWVQIFTIL